MQLLLNALVAGILAGAAFWFTRIAVRMRMSRARDFVKLVVAAFALYFAAAALPVAADFGRFTQYTLPADTMLNGELLPAGTRVCKESTTGALFKGPYSTSKQSSQVTVGCNVITSFLPWLFTADAAPLRLNLGINPDGSTNSGYPCLDGVTNCKAPAPASVGWTQPCLDAALAALNTEQTGTADDINVEQCGTGTDFASATISVVSAANIANACGSDFSITGSTPARTLHNAASAAGAGTCKLKAVYMGSTVVSASFAWATVDPPSSPGRQTPSFRSGALTTSSGAHTTTTDIPAGSVYALVAFAWGSGTANQAPTSVTLDGHAATKISSQETANTTQVALYKVSGFSTGASKTLAWTAPSAYTTLLSGIEFRNGTPVYGDTDSDFGGAGGGGHLTSNPFTDTAGDLIVSVYAGDGGSFDSFGAGQTNLDETVAGGLDFGFTIATGTGGTDTQEFVSATNHAYALVAITEIPGNDTTAPTGVTGISCADGTLSVSCSIDAQMDPSDGVDNTGISKYNFYADGVLVDYLTAASPGLDCDFTAQSIGSPPGSPSATQGTGSSGAAWSVNGRGYGVETNDQYYGVGCAVSGSAVYQIQRIDSLPNASTYNKAHNDIRNVGTAGTEAHYDCVLLRVGSNYYMQRTERTVNGGANGNRSSAALSIAPPMYTRSAVVNNVGECDYSADGGAWTAAFSNDAITLNNAKVAVSGGSATSTGADDTAITVDFGSVAVETDGRLSKILTVPAGTATYTATAVDVAGNESTALGGSSATASSTGGGGGGGLSTAKKWNPGYYVMLPRDYGTRTNQSTRFGYYDRESNNSSFVGWSYMTVWSQLEGATHGDYTAGDAMLLDELSHLASEPSPKKLILALDDELYRGSFSYYPQYVVNAGCVFDELWSDGVHHLYHFKWWIPTCVGYFNDLLTHLGSLLDSQADFEQIILDYEQAYSGDAVNGGQNSQFSRSGFMSGVKSAFVAAAAAFPHTNIEWQANWGVTFHEADLVELLTAAKASGVGWGAQDACSIDPATSQNVYGTYPIYQDSQNIFAGYGGYDTGHHAGTYEDQRGKMFSTDGVEDSELGYHSVCNGTGFAGYATVGNGLRPNYMSLYDEWNAEWNSHARVEYNMETGDDVQRWSVGTTGSLWDMVTNHPLLHTECPTDYDNKFGNGTPGSGCQDGSALSATINITTSAQSILEDAGSFLVCASISQGLSGGASVVIHDAGTGSATSSDYTTTDFDQTLTWPSNTGGQQCTTAIHVANRGGTQGARTINVTATSVSGAVLGSSTTQTITINDAGVAGVHKWYPGHYVRAHSHNLSCGTSCDAMRHSLYTNFMGQANVVGTEIWIDWKYLESDSGDDFTAGISWLTNELAYVASTYPGKKVGLLINIGPYGPSSLSQANSWFPQYFVDAGCVYLEGSAGTAGGSDSLAWYKNNATCLSYFNRMISAYGAAFDSNSTLAWVRIQQETDDASAQNGISGPAEDNAWKNVALDSATAFPTTPIWIPLNWTGVNTAASVESLLLYYKSIGVGVGNGDTQPINLAYPCPSTAWACVVQGLNASIGGTNHNNCGEFVSLGAVELSEMGYNSVTDPYGGLTSQQVATSWNNDTCQQFGVWEPNFGEIGDSDTMYWNGAHGQLWAINNIPITHTAKPAGFN